MVAAQHEQGARERILETARNLFNQRGFHQTSISELASGAQVSVGQIYRLFKSKEDIINAMVSSTAKEREQQIAQLCERLNAGEIDVENTFELLLLHVIDNPTEALSFDILAEGFRNGRVGQTISSMCNGFRHAVRVFACMANPRLTGQTLAVAEELILACMFGLGHRSLSRPELGREATAKGAARMIVTALRELN